MKYHKKAAWLAGLTFLIFGTAALAAVPSVMNYQGRLADSSGKALPDGNYSVTFRFYADSVTATALWQEGQLVGLKDGLFAVVLGGAEPLPALVFTREAVWLGVQVGLGSELSPRTRLGSVGYAFRAGTAEVAEQSLDRTISASELTQGILDTSRYSAYGDLVAEGKIGSGSEQVAPGLHYHLDQTVRWFEDSSWIQLSVPYGDAQLKSLTVPAGMIKRHFRVTWYVQSGSPQYFNDSIYLTINGQKAAGFKTESIRLNHHQILFTRLGGSASQTYRPTAVENYRAAQVTCGDIMIDPNQPTIFGILHVRQETSVTVGALVVECGGQ